MEIEFRFLILFGVGVDRSDGLFGLYFVALLDTQFAEIRIDGTVVTVLDDHGVRAGHHETTCHLAFIDSTRHGIGDSLQVDTFVVRHDLRINGVLLLAEMSADHAFLHRPRQPSFVGLESAGNQLLLFGERGLGRFLGLLTNHLIDLAVQFIHFLLFLLELLAQVFLFGLELVEHVLLLPLIAFEVLLFAFARTQSRLFVSLIGLQQIVLYVDLRLGVLYTTHLLLAEMREFL